MATPGAFLRSQLQSAPRSAAIALAGQGITQHELAEVLQVLQHFTHLTELDLANNGVTDATGLERLQQLTRLDLGGNPINSPSFLPVFSALPLLRHLTVPLASVQEEQLFAARLPHLATLNGYALTTGSRGVRMLAKPNSPAPEPIPPPEITLVGSDLEPVATLFDAIRNLLPAEALAMTKPTDDPFVRRRHTDCRLDIFEKHINETVVALNESLASPPYNASIVLRNSAILKTKHALFEICAQALTSHARVVQPALAECLTSLRASEAGVLGKFAELLQWVDGELETLAHQARSATEQVHQLRDAAEATARRMADKGGRSDAEASLAAVQLQKLQQKLEVERETAAREKKALVALVETLDADVAQAKSAAQVAQENEASLRAQLDAREAYWLERDAAWQARMSTPHQQSDQPEEVKEQPLPQENGVSADAPTAPDFSQSTETPQQPAFQQQSFSQTPSQPLPIQSPQQDLTNAFFPSQSPSSSFFDPHGTPYQQANPSTPFTASNTQLQNPAIPSAHFHPSTTSQALTLHHQSGGPQTSQLGPAATTGRSMTLRQIKDLISEIYVSYDLLTKSLIDSQNVRQESTKETLLQHMYTFLNQRFGLKQLIMDAANSLIKGLNQYANDHTVAVFSGILRHTLDEEFRHTEEKTHRSVRELLKVYLQAKHPRKRDNVIQGMLTERIKGVLNEDEWHDILSYMFAAADRVPISSTIRSLAQQQSAQEVPAPLTGRGRLAAANDAAAAKLSGKLTIKTTTFINILLDFQLHVHRKFLEPFVSLFRLFDTLHSGLLSYEQFTKLVQMLNPSLGDAAIRALLVKGDPFNHGLISFSDCVACLAEELKHLAIKHHRQQSGGAPVAQQPSSGAAPAPSPEFDNSGAFATPQPQASRPPFHVHGQ